MAIQSLSDNIKQEKTGKNTAKMRKMVSKTHDQLFLPKVRVKLSLLAYRLITETISPFIGINCPFVPSIRKYFDVGYTMQF